jgi:hypothetical protein
MISDPKQLLLRFRRPLIVGAWLAWLVSPSIVVANLNLLRRQAWMPIEISHALMTVYENIWPFGVVTLSMIVMFEMIIDHTFGKDATKAQSEYDLSRAKRPPPD